LWSLVLTEEHLRRNDLRPSEEKEEQGHLYATIETQSFTGSLELSKCILAIIT
jgi:hypothetical protein